MDDPQPWRLDKRIPIIPTLVVIAQSASLVWYAAKLDSRMETVERWIATNANTQVSLSDGRGDLRGHEQRLNRLEGGRCPG